MIALPHRRPEPVPAPKSVCGSDALFMVRGVADHDSCGPHLHMMLTDLLAEDTVIFDALPHRRCEYAEVTR